MVLLTMTAAIVEALQIKTQLRETEAAEAASEIHDSDSTSPERNKEPSLEVPAVGKPISHGQIVALWRRLKTADSDSKSSSRSSRTLEQLLRGAGVFVPPPPPKPEPTPEYKALMARLRYEAEARSYERMVNPPSRLERFDARFPHSSAGAFAAANRPSSNADLGDDEVTSNEVHRQVTLLINFLVSIAGVAGTLWVAARWWTLSARLFLTMGGSLVVAVAEVAVYATYVWRMAEAKTKQEGVREVREVVRTWVVGEAGEEQNAEAVVVGRSGDEQGDDTVRKRNTATKGKS